MSNVVTFEGIGVAAMGDVVLVVWNAPARVSRTRWVFDQMDAAVTANPGGILCFQLVLPSSSPPDGPARDENTRRLKKVGGSLKRVVTVPVGDAFWMSVVRAVMRAMTLVSGQAKVQFVVDNESAGLDLLLEAGGPRTPARPVLTTALDDIRRALGVSSGKAA